MSQSFMRLKTNSDYIQSLQKLMHQAVDYDVRQGVFRIVKVALYELVLGNKEGAQALLEAHMPRLDDDEVEISQVKATGLTLLHSIYGLSGATDAQKKTMSDIRNIEKIQGYNFVQYYIGTQQTENYTFQDLVDEVLEDHSMSLSYAAEEIQRYKSEALSWEIEELLYLRMVQPEYINEFPQAASIDFDSLITNTFSLLKDALLLEE